MVKLNSAQEKMLRVLRMILPWIDELMKELEQLRSEASYDDLTELFRIKPARRAFHRLYKHDERRTPDQAPRFMALFIDIDHFKSINDTYGHAKGDQVLRTVARHLIGSFRAEDIIFRNGGEELVVIMPNASQEDACRRGAQFQKALRRDDELLRILSGRVVTATIGVAQISTDYRDPNQAFDDALERADRAMYEGKAAGRDCIIIAD